jgi:SAM-dependent methyltransferase
MVMKRLNLGCGNDIRQGWVNLDSADLPGVDVVHDIEKVPLPFKNDEFDEIECQNVLEHVEYIRVLRDLYRILKRGGTLKIRVPHYTSFNNYVDPTHKKRFSIRTFEFFIQRSKFCREYYFDFHFSGISYSRIVFQKKYFPFNFLVEYIVNMSSSTQILYESSFLSRLFPAMDVVVKFVK